MLNPELLRQHFSARFAAMTMIEFKRHAARLNPKRQLELAAFLIHSAVENGKANQSRLSKECAKLRKSEEREMAEIGLASAIKQ